MTGNHSFRRWRAIPEILPRTTIKQNIFILRLVLNQEAESFEIHFLVSGNGRSYKSGGFAYHFPEFRSQHEAVGGKGD